MFIDIKRNGRFKDYSYLCTEKRTVINYSTIINYFINLKLLKHEEIIYHFAVYDSRVYRNPFTSSATPRDKQQIPSNRISRRRREDPVGV
jgi:hypothetical protein